MEHLPGIAGIFLSLILLIVLAYRGISVIIHAPLLAMLAVVFSGAGHKVLATAGMTASPGSPTSTSKSAPGRPGCHGS